MKRNKIKKHHKINREISFPTVHLVGDNLEFTGDYNFEEAIKLAESMGLDLVLINEQNRICKLINYEKFIYDLNKKPKNKNPELKEVKFSYAIGDHDVAYRVEQIKGFLKDKHKVKLSMMFRGREMQFKEKGKEVLLKVAVALEGFGVAESLPLQDGKFLFLTIKPK